MKINLIYSVQACFLFSLFFFAVTIQVQLLFQGACMYILCTTAAMYNLLSIIKRQKYNLVSSVMYGCTDQGAWAKTPKHPLPYFIMP